MKILNGYNNDDDDNAVDEDAHHGDDDGDQVRGAEKTTCKGMRGAGYPLDILRGP